MIGYGTVVYGASTCRIPAQNGEKTKDLTGYTQWRMVKYHATN